MVYYRHFPEFYKIILSTNLNANYPKELTKSDGMGMIGQGLTLLEVVQSFDP
jgi:hypothetical protein